MFYFFENIQEITQCLKEKTKKSRQKLKEDLFYLPLDRLSKICPYCPKSVNSSTHICSSFSGVISVVSPVGERRASGSNSGKVVQAVRRSGHYCNVCYPCWSLHKEDQGSFTQTHKCSRAKKRHIWHAMRWGPWNNQEQPTQTLIKTHLLSLIRKLGDCSPKLCRGVTNNQILGGPDR